MQELSVGLDDRAVHAPPQPGVRRGDVAAGVAVEVREHGLEAAQGEERRRVPVALVGRDLMERGESVDAVAGRDEEHGHHDRAGREQSGPQAHGLPFIEVRPGGRPPDQFFNVFLMRSSSRSRSASLCSSALTRASSESPRASSSRKRVASGGPGRTGTAPAACPPRSTARR